MLNFTNNQENEKWKPQWNGIKLSIAMFFRGQGKKWDQEGGHREHWLYL